MRYAFLAAALFFLVSGCQEEASRKSEPVEPIGSQGGMASYLERRGLPSLNSVEPWDSEYGAGLKLTTDHYVIYTTLLEPLMLAEVPGFLESSYRGYQKQFPEKIETENRFEVYLFSDRNQWEAFTDYVAGPQAELYKQIRAGAYVLKGMCVAYNIGRERTLSVLGHEGWHQFNSRHFRYRLPSWLDEGVAMQFETFQEKGGMFIFQPALNVYRIGSLKQSLMTGNVIPLGHLLAMNPGEVVGSSDYALAAFYSQSYALVRFLREANYGRRLGNYHAMMLGGLYGEWPLDDTLAKIAANRNIPLTVSWNRAVGSKLFELYIGEDFASLEEEYFNYCRKLVYNVRIKRQ